MGCYVNPTNETKEEFLKREGVETTTPTITADSFPVCWGDSGPFTFAAIAYKPSEIEAFSRPEDNRPKIWFQVPLEKLEKVSNIKSYL